MQKVTRDSYELDSMLARVGIIISILFSIIIIYKGMNEIYLLIFFLSASSFILWLIIKNNSNLEFNSSKLDKYYKLYISSFILLFVFSITSLNFRQEIYQRPIIYFIIISIMVGLVSIQITTYNKSRKSILILFQVIILGISLAWSQTLIFPDLVGFDPWFHQYFTLGIIESGYIPQGFTYSKLPLFHLLITFTSLVVGLDYKYSTMFSVSLSQIICNVLFIFLISKYIFDNNYKVGFLASELTIISNFHIFMSYWSIPNSFAFIFVLPIIYLMIKVKKQHPVYASILSILFAITLILIHTITAMFMCITIFIFSLATYIYKYFEKEEFKSVKIFKLPDRWSQVYEDDTKNTKKLKAYQKPPTFTITYWVLYSVFMFGWWTYASEDIVRLAKLIKWGFSVDTFLRIPIEASKYVIEIPFIDKLVNNTGMFLYFSLSFMGCLYMISKNKRNNLSFNMVLVGITPLILGFISLITGHSIIEQRWWYFAETLLSIPLSISIIVLFNLFKNEYQKHILLSVFLVFLSLSLILSPAATCDNPLSKNGITNSFTCSELQSLSTISNKWRGEILSDQFYSSTQSYYYNIGNFDNLLISDEKNYKNNIVLIRNNAINKPFMGFDTLIFMEFEDLLHRLNIDSNPKVYDCGSVYAYRYYSN